MITRKLIIMLVSKVTNAITATITKVATNVAEVKVKCLSVAFQCNQTSSMTIKRPWKVPSINLHAHPFCRTQTDGLTDTEN